MLMIPKIRCWLVTRNLSVVIFKVCHINLPIKPTENLNLYVQKQCMTAQSNAELQIIAFLFMFHSFKTFLSLCDIFINNKMFWSTES